MKVMVMFDLPSTEPHQRYTYDHFRQRLLKWGFEPFQKSIYVKDCDHEAHAKVVARLLETIIPPEGKVTACTFTDRQWANTMQYEEGAKVETEPETRQMVMLL